ncbi:MAG: carbamoyltransferase HypF, partial [Pyrinomonadaceae bacterium]|nr:carbamoyltransferase HypF [Pyrinomonadaceae bacterium]
VEDLLDGFPASIVSARFHLAVARLIVSIAKKVRSERRLNRVVLSGGVFQNVFLLEKTCELLQASGFQSFTHARVPTNDGGISLGQASIANAQIKLGRI